MTLVVETRGGGASLMLLHGWGFGSRVWDGVSDELAQSFRVSRVELPGYPRSRAGGHRTFDAIVGELIKDLGEETHVLGWSLGGMLTLGLARSAPEKVGKIILVSTNLRFTSCEGWPHAMQPEAFSRFRNELAFDVRSTLHRFGALVAQGSANVSAEVRYFRQQIRECGLPETTALEDGLVILEELDLRPPGYTARHPTLFIFGKNDALVPSDVVTDIQKNLPDARTLVFGNTGHAPFLTCRHKFIDTVRGFLV